MKYPKISIVTPSFNQADFIPATITSIVSQNYPSLEYIINDGGSTDGSVKIIKDFARRHKSIIWRSHKDSGQVAAINEGFHRATGDIMAYLNSDDYYHPGVLFQVAEFFRHHPDTAWLVGNCNVTDPNLKWTFAAKHLWPIHAFPALLYVFNTVNQPAVFLSRRLVKAVGDFDTSLKYAFDYDYWLRCLKIAPPKRLFSTLATFRVHSSSKGNTGWTIQFQEDSDVVRRFTQNGLWLSLHRVGSQLTTSAYRRLKP